MEPFTYVGQPCRIVWGPGAARTLAEEIGALGAGRALFCATPGGAARVAALAQSVGPLAAGICDRALPFTPIAAAEAGRAMARDLGADCLVASGGGNATGLAKAIALETGLPIIALPTTYSGSETTALQGIREGGKRINHASPRMLPKTVIYDPELSAGLPLSVSIPSGIHAMAHAVSAFFGRTRNPVSILMAEDGIARMAAALPKIAADPADLDVRGEALYAAFLSASTVMSSSTVLHHKVCHVLAGDFGLPHAETNTIVLPHSTAYNREVAPDAMRRIARAFGDEKADAPASIFALLRKSGAPTALKDLGLAYEALDRATSLILTDPYFNPRAYERDAIRALLEGAWNGTDPRP